MPTTGALDLVRELHMIVALCSTMSAASLSMAIDIPDLSRRAIATSPGRIMPPHLGPLSHFSLAQRRARVTARPRVGYLAAVQARHGRILAKLRLKPTSE